MTTTDPKLMEQVKVEPGACPFCGGKDIRTMVGVRSKRGFSMLCGGCGIRQGLAGRTKSEAIAAWNERANPQPAAVDGLVEALAPFKAEFQDMGLNAHIADDDLMLDVDCGGEILTAGHWRALMKALAQIERKPEDGNG